MRMLRLIIVVLLLVSTVYPEGTRTNITYTVTAGTPQRLATTTTLVNKIMIQMKTGGSGRGYVMAGMSTTPSTANTAHVTAELCPATATAPGCSYSDSDPYGIDISLIWLDVATTGDRMIVTYDLR